MLEKRGAKLAEFLLGSKCNDDVRVGFAFVLPSATRSVGLSCINVDVSLASLPQT